MAQNGNKIAKTSYDRMTDELTKDMPVFAKQFIDSRKGLLKDASRYEYARDMSVFIRYVRNDLYKIGAINIEETLSKLILDASPDLIKRYLNEITLYSAKSKEKPVKNSDKGKSRKLAVLRSFYKYLNEHGITENNPAALIVMPKNIKGKATIMATDQEKALISAMDKEGNTGSSKRKELYARNHLRDKAIILLFLRGLSAAEIVSLDIGTVDLGNKHIIIADKGQTETKVFSDQAKDILAEYLDSSMTPGTRQSYNPPEDEKALFLTIKGSRMSVRTLQNMLKTYAQDLFDIKTKQGAHNLRETFQQNTKI